MTGRTDSDPLALDRSEVRRAFDRASSGYDAAAVLQAEVRNELLDRLQYARLQPRVILDAGCGTGHGSRALLKRYRGSSVVALDLSEGMLHQTRRRRPLLRRLDPVCADAAGLPLPDDSVDLIFSNLMLQWCNDPDAVFGEFRRVLKPGGLLSFSSFGPDTLRELRQAWRAVDGEVHVSRFIDMHDLGDAMIRAGLSEPVMDVDYFSLTYDDVYGLMRDLKAIGAHNATHGRRRGLTGRGRIQALVRAYESYRQDGRLPATWEIVYGQAWGVAASRPVMTVDGEARIPVSAVGRRRPGTDA
ncbi:MAG: malonyl-ACP O-methyltransferase BioC [Gammaproteobacteria bacterium]|jgi:malonyl-CoA O-methyltransferase